MAKHFDMIVLGSGGVGSATIYYLSKAGFKVLGIDQFHMAHDRGSSHGQTRAIRQAYFEHPQYVPLIKRSYELWRDLEKDSGQNLFSEIGVLEIGPADGIVLPGVIKSAREHNLPIERLEREEVLRRFPQLLVPEGMEAVFEPTGGFLNVESCIQAYLKRAQNNGAELIFDTKVLNWEKNGASIKVTTQNETYSSDKMVVCAGAWTGEILPEIKKYLTIKRKCLFWYGLKREYENNYFSDAGMPVFLYELPSGVFYGFPALDETGLKVAMHSGGEKVLDPTLVDRTIKASDHKMVDSFVKDHLPGVADSLILNAKTCMYTMSPDEHFILDYYSSDRDIAFVTGLSGHGFKFASVLGECLAKMAVNTPLDLPTSCFKFNRF